VKNHTVAQCVANRLQGETSCHCTVEKFMLKKLAVHSRKYHAGSSYSLVELNASVVKTILIFDQVYLTHGGSSSRKTVM
jgi:hypothetical protein